MKLYSSFNIKKNHFGKSGSTLPNHPYIYLYVCVYRVEIVEGDRFLKKST